LAFAACALEHGAHLWTVNRSDFADIPDLKLYDAPS
jgi:predicted nucleic acid-binding protein